MILSHTTHMHTFYLTWLIIFNQRLFNYSIQLCHNLSPFLTPVTFCIYSYSACNCKTISWRCNLRGYSHFHFRCESLQTHFQMQDNIICTQSLHSWFIPACFEESCSMDVRASSSFLVWIISSLRAVVRCFSRKYFAFHSRSVALKINPYLVHILICINTYV